MTQGKSTSGSSIRDRKCPSAYPKVVMDRLSGWRIVPLLEWLAIDARDIEGPNKLTEALSERLCKCGAPIIRLRLSVSDERLDIPGWSAVWRIGQPFDQDRVAAPGFKDRPSYMASPIAEVDATQRPYRVKLESLDKTTTHPVLTELAAQGASDYLALPVRASAIGLASITVLTDRMGGFEDEDIMKFEVLASALAPAFEAVELRRRSREIATNDD